MNAPTDEREQLAYDLWCIEYPPTLKEGSHFDLWRTPIRLALNARWLADADKLLALGYRRRTASTAVDDERHGPDDGSEQSGATSGRAGSTPCDSAKDQDSAVTRLTAERDAALKRAEAAEAEGAVLVTALKEAGRGGTSEASICGAMCRR